MKTGKTSQHGKDLRKGRYSENNRIYLVTSVTYQRQKVFSNFSLGRLVVLAFRYQHQQQNVNNLAYVVMPDHFHWLFSLQNDYSLAEVIRGVKGRSSYQIQNYLLEQREVAGKQILWQKGYYDHAVRKDVDLKKLARYITANPLRAGLVDNIADYPLWDAVWL